MGWLDFAAPVLNIGTNSLGMGNISDFNMGSITNARNSLFGINDQANAAQSAAEAEQRQRQAVTGEARSGADRSNLAAQSPQQLAALSQGLSSAQKQNEMDMRQLAAIDPAIMEASKQVMSLLQGKGSTQSNMLAQQRQTQRQQLIDSLRAQYGPGAESSSIGQQALQRFDMESNSLVQGTLNNLMGIATARPNGQGFSQLMGASQGYGGYQNRVLGAEQQGSSNVLAGMGAEVQGAGAQYTGDYLRASANRQFYEGLESDARQIGRTWATGGMGGAKDTAGSFGNPAAGFNGSQYFSNGASDGSGYQFNGSQQDNWNGYPNPGGGSGQQGWFYGNSPASHPQPSQYSSWWKD